MDDFAVTASPDLVDSLNEGIVTCIRSSGKQLPSSAITSHAQCQWTEYASVPRDVDGVVLCSPVVDDLSQFFPPLNKYSVGSNGRHLLYSACLGLLLSTRSDDAITEANEARSTNPLSTFLSIASFLLDEIDADPNQPTETKGACHRPPLHLVARSCHPDGVQLLLSRGADADQADDEGWTALMACCLPDIRTQEEGGPTVDERVGTVKFILGHLDAEDVDARNYCGYTALHYACEGLNSDLIQCLLKEGNADATLRTIWGQSCIGIVKSECDNNPEEAGKCEAVLMSHLESTGQLEDIQAFLNEERKAIELTNLVEGVMIPASRRPKFDSSNDGISCMEALRAQDQRIITALMKHLDLDPSDLFQQNLVEKLSHNNENVYEVMHRRILDLVPLALRQVYCNRNPTCEEREIVTCMNSRLRKSSESSVDGVRRIDPITLMNQAFCLHRERGHIARQIELLTDLMVGPLQRTFAFAIPSNATLKMIISHAPNIVEVGAGTGYWSSMLAAAGADVVAFDANPPVALDEGDEHNVYFGRLAYFPVQKGVASTVFDASVTMEERALLIVWPNNPDNEDNPHVAVEGFNLPPVWDLECLQTYYNVGGKTIIYVGEREDKINLMHGASASDCGFCSSRAFQRFLKEKFELTAEIECPTWWMKNDDITIWKRK
ncbi:predicted protein [Thalassiosira pseudonana CCMP1335]|uniref:Uncharacterized protein n=1 Tax=Thalassiosira pseudonana TaxID=35128 RepID=B8BUT5_THAPS|nr:predicted protein [Thalassiosira pseudonana CCMP1335]EED94815.1 predicted protein [Thalassiosira pseudonana CCMP1335]|eukprot:scaffold808_cov196-Alexandrium_tamarense.AAC.59